MRACQLMFCWSHAALRWLLSSVEDWHVIKQETKRPYENILNSTQRFVKPIGYIIGLRVTAHKQNVFKLRKNK